MPPPWVLTALPSVSLKAMPVARGPLNVPTGPDPAAAPQLLVPLEPPVALDPARPPEPAVALEASLGRRSTGRCWFRRTRPSCSCPPCRRSQASRPKSRFRPSHPARWCCRPSPSSRPERFRLIRSCCWLIPSYRRLLPSCRRDRFRLIRLCCWLLPSCRRLLPSCRRGWFRLQRPRYPACRLSPCLLSPA